MMSGEIAESFCGTCHIMIEYYKALRKNVIHNNLHKSPKKLRGFINKLKKSSPLVRQSGVTSKREKKDIESVMASVHKHVVKDLCKWQKHNKNDNDILEYISEQIKHHETMIKSIINADSRSHLHKKKRGRSKRRSVLSHIDSDTDSDEDSDEDSDSDEENILCIVQI